jgi:hypothetical protein
MIRNSKNTKKKGKWGNVANKVAKMLLMQLAPKIIDWRIEANEVKRLKEM